MKLTWMCMCGIPNCEGVAEVCDFYNTFNEKTFMGTFGDLCTVPRVRKCTNHIKSPEATGDPEHGLDFVEAELYEGFTHKVCSECQTNGNLTKLLNYTKTGLLESEDDWEVLSR